MSYASTDDLQAALTAAGMGNNPANAQLLLDRAGRLIRRATMTAVYVADTDGNATDATIAAAFKDATIEHVLAWLGLGSDGTPNPYQTVTAGRISLGRGTTSNAGGAIADGDVLAPQAYLILQAAGLTSQEPWL